MPALPHQVHTLGFKLTVIILLKVAFLFALWHAVLQYQKVHVDTPMMAERLLSSPTTPSHAQPQEK